MRSACLVRTHYILNNFSGIGLGGPRTPPLGYAPARPRSNFRVSVITRAEFVRYCPWCTGQDGVTVILFPVSASIYKVFRQRGDAGAINPVRHGTEAQLHVNRETLYCFLT